MTRRGPADEIGEILFDERIIEERVAELAAEVSRDYAGRELVVVCVLKAAFMFTADLVRRITLPVDVEFIRASSYGGGRSSSGEVRLLKDLDRDIVGKHVLLADTIIDTGGTMKSLFERFERGRPASVNAVVLLDKQTGRKSDVPIAYRGFVVPDCFVVGYGMDCGDRYRNLPVVAALGTDSPSPIP